MARNLDTGEFCRADLLEFSWYFVVVCYPGRGVGFEIYMKTQLVLHVTKSTYGSLKAIQISADGNSVVVDMAKVQYNYVTVDFRVQSTIFTSHIYLEVE